MNVEGLPVCVLVSSQSRSTSEGALGREYNDTGCSSGHSIATLLIFMHPKGIHSSGRYNYNHVMDMEIYIQLKSTWATCIQVHHVLLF